MVFAVVLLVDPRVAAVEDEDDDAVAGAGAGAGTGGGGGLGFAYSYVHCRAVLSCWARLQMNSVSMFWTGDDN